MQSFLRKPIQISAEEQDATFRHMYVVRLHPQSGNDEVCVLEATLLKFYVLWDVKRQRSGRLKSPKIVTY
jgi:hypothetical protein